MSTVQKVVLSLILWATATSWSAILESKKWTTWLEGARLLAMGVALAWVATLGRGTQSSPLTTAQVDDGAS